MVNIYLDELKNDRTKQIDILTSLNLVMIL